MDNYIVSSSIKKTIKHSIPRAVGILLSCFCCLIVFVLLNGCTELEGDQEVLPAEAVKGEEKPAVAKENPESAPPGGEKAVTEQGDKAVQEASAQDITAKEAAAKEAEEAKAEAAKIEAAKKAEAAEAAEVAKAKAAKEAEQKAEAAEKQRLIDEEKRRAIEEVKIRRAFKEMKIYQVDIEPLGLADCIRCHISQTARLREKGGKHRRVACTDCHRQYHAYNPSKDNFIDIMPKCSFCHSLHHGDSEGVSTCLNCHFDPHQPRTVPDPDKIEDQCRICHTPIGALLDEKPSKHTERKCSECHSKKHGRKPECSECHQNHSPKLELTTVDCMKCHPVHTPLEISYPITQSKELCGGCHVTPYDDLQNTVTKHSELTCAKCHPKHGYLPKCSECHGEQVHHEGIHETKPVCGDCHTIAHKLNL